MRLVLILSACLLFMGCGGEGNEPTEPVDEVMDEIEPEPPIVITPECPNRADLLSFLRQVLKDEIRGNKIIIFESQPELRFAEGTTAYQREVTREAIQLLNNALPDAYKVLISSVDAPARSIVGPSVGAIYIDFAPTDEWLSGIRVFDGVLGFTINFFDGAHVWINSERFDSFSPLINSEVQHL